MAKEKPKSTPKPKPAKVLQNMFENGCSMKQAMIDAGYSEAYAHNPDKFRRTATFQELLKENLPDWLLTEKHLELLGDEDSAIRLRAIQEAYKIKDKYAPEKHEHTIRDYQDLSDEELAEIYDAKTNKNSKRTDD